MPGNGVIWLLLAAIVVMFMHIGFAMIETGFCRAKNALNTVAMNLMVFPLSCLAFWVYGFAVGWGNFSNGAVAPGWAAALDLPGTILNRGAGRRFPAGRGRQGKRRLRLWPDRRQGILPFRH